MSIFRQEKKKMEAVLRVKARVTFPQLELRVKVYEFCGKFPVPVFTYLTP